MNNGVLAIWTDIPAESEADFNAWYNHEHLAERAGIAGFINGRRYRAIDAEPRYLALYDTESVAVLSSAPYHARLDDPTPWTQRNVAQFQNVTRSTFNVRYRLGGGCGGLIATLRLLPQPGRADELENRLTQSLLPALADHADIVKAELLQAGRSDASDTTSEGKLRTSWEQGELWAILIEATDLEVVRIACRDLLNPAGLQAHGAAEPVRTGFYQLLYALGQAGRA